MKSAPSTPQFDLEKFKEQVGYDRDLLIEIIDLFLSESVKQLAEIHAALGKSDYQTLSRLAHTLKGSFGSLHAESARLHAHELEIVAHNRDEEACRTWISALELDFAMLQPQLISLRESSEQL
jgi:HPt (histidine-containing phosphotransfer) domain-containing protein